MDGQAAFRSDFRTGTFTSLTLRVAGIALVTHTHSP